MITKTLLIAAAALAVGIVSSQAQVYSQNIVGYANIATPSASVYYLLECPFQIGASNGANEVFGTTLPDFTQVLTWDVTHQTYVVSLYDSSQPTPGFSWYDINDSVPVTIPVLPPGQGFFLYPGDNHVTNTFAGTVAVASGATNNTSLPSASVYYLVGSTIPFDGFVTNHVTGTSQGVNLVGTPDFTQVLTWNVGSQSYVVSLYDSSQPTPGSTWYDINDSIPQVCPSVTVGQGFFVVPGDNGYIWTQSLP